ncbi:hypothetical protein Dimus_031441 [Dionaea muscipula]
MGSSVLVDSSSLPYLISNMKLQTKVDPLENISCSVCGMGKLGWVGRWSKFFVATISFAGSWAEQPNCEGCMLTVTHGLLDPFD